MDIHGIQETLKNHKCLTCDNLTYWDWYMCKLGKHTTQDGFLHKGCLENCDEYIKREGTNWDRCKGQECLFWCTECSAYPNK